MSARSAVAGGDGNSRTVGLHQSARAVRVKAPVKLGRSLWDHILGLPKSVADTFSFIHRGDFSQSIWALVIRERQLTFCVSQARMARPSSSPARDCAGDAMGSRERSATPRRITNVRWRFG